MTDEAKTTTPETTASEPQAEAKIVVNGAQDGGKEVKDPTTIQAPAPETILKTEHDKLVKAMKDGHSGTTAQMRQEREALQAKLEALEDKMEESSYENWIRALEEKGVDNIDLAKQVAQRDKDSRKSQREFEREKTKLTALKAELDQAGKGKAAYDLAKEFKLDEAVVPQLLAMENDWAMRAKAQELYIETLKTTALPRENPDPGEGSSKGVDLSRMSDTEKFGWALEQISKSK